MITMDQDNAASRQKEPVVSIGRAGKGLMRVTRSDLISHAKSTLLAGKRVDMAALASELQIARATLYRWSKDREHLLNEVFLMLVDETFDWIEHRAEEKKLCGIERIMFWVEQMMRTSSGSAPIRTMLHNEPNLALKILTNGYKQAGTVQRKVIQKLESIICHEVEEGTYVARLDSVTLAHVIIRLTDSFIYGDIIGGAEVDQVEIAKVIRSLLEGLDQA